MRISDWSSDVCSSDLDRREDFLEHRFGQPAGVGVVARAVIAVGDGEAVDTVQGAMAEGVENLTRAQRGEHRAVGEAAKAEDDAQPLHGGDLSRSEEHTSELQSLMRISYAVFCLKQQKNNNNT